MEKREMMYEGKAKKVYATDNKDEVVIYYKDDATAFNGVKKGQIHDKGVMNNKITSILFEQLEKQGIKTHFIKKLSDREQLCKKVEIVPLEVIVRNVAAGSMAKRLGLEEGTALKTTVFEFSYKDDALNDPLINSYHAVAIGATTFEELKVIGAELGYCSNRKEYKANPESYKGMISDVAGAVRSALSHRTNTPDLYTIMQIMGEEKVRERFNKFINL